MCKKCGKEIPTTEENVYWVPISSSLAKIARERNIEETIKRNGQLIVKTQNKDCDEKGDFIGDYSHLRKIAEHFVRKYNPEGLSVEEYRAAYEAEELLWQNQSTVRGLFVNKDIEKKFHDLDDSVIEKEMPSIEVTEKTRRESAGHHNSFGKFYRNNIK